MKLKIFLFFIVLTILYGIYGPPEDGREPYPSYPPDPIVLTSLGISLDRLKQAKYICKEENFKNPEDVIIDDDGNLYAGLHDGSIIKINPERKHQRIGKGKGLILGLAWSNNKKQFYFADQLGGIGKMNTQTHELKFVVSKQKYPEVISPNSVTVGQDDLVYFTNTGNVLMNQYHKEMFRGHPDGAVFVFDPSTDKVEILAKNLFFPNGIAHNRKSDPKQECVYVAETCKFRVLKIYTKGAKKGQSEVIVENLPGFLDNMKLAPDGNLWVATPALRDHITNLIDQTIPIRRVLLNLRFPLAIVLFFQNLNYAGGVKIDTKKNEVMEYFYGKPDRTSFVTGITEHKGKIYMSSLQNPCIAVVPYK